MDRDLLIALAVMVSFVAAFLVKLARPEWGMIAWGSFLGIGGLVWLIFDRPDTQHPHR